MDSDVIKISNGVDFTDDWEYVVFSFSTENFFPSVSSTADPVIVNFYINDIQVQSDCTLPMFPSSISAVTIGSGYSGLLQDVAIEARPVTESDITSVSRTEASFIPQCLCPLNSSLSANEESCGSTPR